MRGSWIRKNVTFLLGRGEIYKFTCCLPDFVLKGFLQHYAFIKVVYYHLSVVKGWLPRNSCVFNKSSMEETGKKGSNNPKLTPIKRWPCEIGWICQFFRNHINWIVISRGLTRFGLSPLAWDGENDSAFTFVGQISRKRCNFEVTS